MAARDSHDKAPNSRAKAYAHEKRSETIARRLQDEIAVSLLTRAFDAIERGDASAFDVDLAATFIAALDDGTLADERVYCSTRDANALVLRVKRYGRPQIAYQREAKPRRVSKQRQKRWAMGVRGPASLDDDDEQ